MHKKLLAWYQSFVGSKTPTSQMIRSAKSADLPSVKHLADRHKRELGFVLNPALRDAIQEERVIIDVHQGQQLAGFLHFRHRRDRVTKIYQICVEGCYRRQGYGKAMISELARRALSAGQTSIVLACPEDLLANKFYEAYGFIHSGLVPGRVRSLVQWSLKIGRASTVVASEAERCH